jgi:hypothetical protein
MTAPRPKAVVVGSLALFAVLFVLLTFQLSASAPSASAGHDKAAAKVRPVAEPEYVEPEPEEVPPVVTSSS